MINESLVKPDRVYTVSEITRLVKLEVENAFPVLWVEGEISNCRCYPSGHIYFTLKDEQCQLQAVMWRSNARLLKFELKDGLKVVCRGKISIYEARNSSMWPNIPTLFSKASGSKNGKMAMR